MLIIDGGVDIVGLLDLTDLLLLFEELPDHVAIAHVFGSLVSNALIPLFPQPVLLQQLKAPVLGWLVPRLS